MTDPLSGWRLPQTPASGLLGQNTDPAVGSSTRSVITLPPGMPAIRCLFQPIVDLATERAVGFEALARGVDDTSAAGNSDALFAWAKRTGGLRELDWACRITAMQSALRIGLQPGCGLFINVEPAALGGPLPAGFTELVEAVRSAGLAVVIEFTERALSDNTPGLLRLGDWVREQGWAVAIDDIGADPGSLALVPLLKPEIIKLDLRLIQARTTVDVAQIVNAVNAEADRTGALVLAEGIETERHAALAVSMGAHLGQGWFYGRPASDPSVLTCPLPELSHAAQSGAQLPDVPWDLVCDSPKVRRAEKALLEAMSRHLERQAMTSTDPVVVVGSFQNAEQYHAATARRFAALAASGAVVAVLGRGIADQPSAGVQGQSLSSHDPILKEWTIAVVTAHFAGALIARDCGDDGDDAGRRFDYVVTYDRPTVLDAAEIMLRRFIPRSTDEPGADRAVSTVSNPELEAVRQEKQLRLLAKAISASGNGITIVDATAPDYPLVYVNEGFERMTGYLAGDMLGRNCRFLQGPQTDRHAIAKLQAMVASGQGGQVTVLNYRRNGSTWWNEVHISPVLDTSGKLTHFIGVQNDVTARVNADRAAETMPPAVTKTAATPTTPAVSPTWPNASLFRTFAEPQAQAQAGIGPVGRHAKPASGGRNALDTERLDFSTSYGDTVLHHGAANRRRFEPGADAEMVLDPMTGLPDRVGAKSYLHALLSAATRNSSVVGVVALLLCSLDRFQVLDDEQPRVAEDPILEVAQALGNAVGSEVLFRSGSDEFGVACRLDGQHPVVSAYALAGQMHQAVMRVQAHTGISLSIGIALSPEDGQTGDDLWRRAETALVLAEDSGPNSTRYAGDVAIALHRYEPAPFGSPHVAGAAD